MYKWVHQYSRELISITLVDSIDYCASDAHANILLNMDLQGLDLIACYQNRELKTNFFVLLTFETKCIAKLADYLDPKSTFTEKTKKIKDK